MFENLSKQALEIVETFGKDKILDAWEKLGHDGYDDIGPKSDIWDLYIVDSDKVIHEYHREYWFHGEDNEPYTKLDDLLIF